RLRCSLNLPRCYFGRVRAFSADSQVSSEITAATAAIAAVSARRMDVPKDAEIQPWSRNNSSSSSAHPPSGPRAKIRSSLASSDWSTSFNIICCSDSARTMRFDAGSPTSPNITSRGNIEFLPDPGTKHPCQMLGVRAGESGAIARNFVGDPAASRHALKNNNHQGHEDTRRKALQEFLRVRLCP